MCQTCAGRHPPTLHPWPAVEDAESTSSHAGISPGEEAAFPHRAPFNQKGAVETERPVTHTTRALGKDMRTVGNSQESRMTWQDMKTLPAPEGSGDSQGCAACPCEWLRPAFQQLPLWTGWFSSPRTDAGCGRAIWVIHASTAETPKRHFPRKRGQYLPGLLKAPD